MKELHIGETLARKRREKGITQEHLARFIGVSKASVSKWETGNSYPDVIFLPQLATYFNISLDELMGYAPQLTYRDIRKIYTELIELLSTQPLNNALSQCLSTARKYYACFPLLYHIGVLLLNYGPALEEETQKSAMLQEAKMLFVRVKELSDHIELSRLALQNEALCEMMQAMPQNVVMLLENEIRHSMHPSIEAQLSQAYQMLNNHQEAKMVMQGSVFNAAVMLYCELTSYLGVCTDDFEVFETTCHRAVVLDEVFHLHTVFPLVVLSFYMAAAEGYMKLSNTDHALSMLESYTRMVTKPVCPLTINPDDYFSMVVEIREKQLEEGSILMPELPRDERTIKQDIVNALTENPAFAALKSLPLYESLTDKLNEFILR